MFRIIYSVNNDYIPYLYVCLKSLISHIKNEDMYSIYVLYTDVSELNKENIKKLQQKNVKIFFIDVNPFFNDEIKKSFVVNTIFTPETYYRFFLPKIFPDVDKALYMDADTLVLHDISSLFKLDIENYYIAATNDYEIIRVFNSCGKVDESFKDYFVNILKIDSEKYFQAGVMLVNLKKMRQDNITDELLSCLKRIKKPRYVDQDILNVVCQNNVKYIPIKWDYMWHIPITDIEYKNHLPQKYIKMYLNTGCAPWIVHFTGIKPTEYVNMKYAKMFCKYLQNSPYQSWLDNKLVANDKKQKSLIELYKAKIRKYILLKVLTLGFCNKKYNKKIQNRKNDLNKIYEYCIK